MTKRISKRFLSLLLAVVLVISLMPVTMFTALADTSGTLTGLLDESIGLSYDGSADSPWSADNATIDGSVISAEGSNCSSTAYDSTLTITNKKDVAATLSFDYEIAQNEGLIKVDGNTITANGNYSNELAAGSSIVVYIKSGSTSATTTITLKNIKLVANVNATTTFVPSENGSYTVNGTAITENTEMTQSSKDAYTLVATAASGYSFLGWYNETGKCVSINASTTLNIENDCTITARFIANSIAVFVVGGQPFTDLNEASNYAVSTSQGRIILVQSGTISGDYIIPAGVTLLIPFDSDYTLYTTRPVYTTDQTLKCSAYKTLTLASGSSITVNGAISVGGKHFTSSNQVTCKPIGPYGLIKLEADSSIVLNDGANLYAWGYITGDGTVTAKSGSTVYEYFQVVDWRGGSATALKFRNNSGKVFPFSQYYVQNIEAALTLHSGAKENVYISVTASDTTVSSSVPFIGEGALFSLGEDGTLTKKFVPSEKKLKIDISGTAYLNSIKLSINMGFTITFDSSDYVLPINGNIDININSGTTTVTKDVAFLPGVITTVAEGAELKIASGASLYLYDTDEWSANYIFGANSLPYSPSVCGSHSFDDAKIVVNGTLTAAGSIYTTTGGANICSTGNGRFVLESAPGTATVTYQATQSGSDVTFVEIPITAAQLKNANGTFTQTSDKSAGTTVSYYNGVWGIYHTVTWKNWDGSVLKTDVVTEGTTPSYTGATPTKAGDAQYSYTFKEWSPAISPVTGDVTYTAQFTQTTNTYTITWKNDDGETLDTQTLEYGTMPEYTGATPTKAGDAQYSYTFKEWSPAISPVTGDVTYTAQFTQTVNKYTITWKNWNGDTLKTETLDYGTMPKYTGETPAKDSDREHSYTFDGWYDESDNKLTDETIVTGDVTYTAKFTESARTYTVIWKNYDGSVLETDKNVSYGAAHSYDGATPTKKSTEQYEYIFAGWTGPDYDVPNGEIIYTAKFTERLRSYTITWVNDDGKTLDTQTLEYGTMPEYEGETPSKDSTKQYTYTFAGWTPEVTTVTKAATYTATYKATTRSYTITWKVDGQKDVTATVEYGKTPVYPGETPTKASTVDKVFTFNGWDPEVTTVNGPATYTAQFTESAREYTITWNNWDGSLLGTTSVAYGETPVYTGETPTKESDAQYSYRFSGWDPEVTTVTEAATYTAKFTPTTRTYTVIWKVDGQADVTNTLEYGDTIVAPADPSKESDNYYDYTFVGWFDNDNNQFTEGTTVTGDVTYTAKFNENYKNYTITWKVDGVEYEKKSDAHYGDTIVAPTDPSKESTEQYTYTFAGWFDTDNNKFVKGTKVTGNVTYTAKFEATDRLYDVTWVVGDESTTKQYKYDELITAPADPSKESDNYYDYRFIGWFDKDNNQFTEGTKVTGNVTYTAKFEATDRYYDVTWVVGDESTTKQYKYDELITAPADPSKDSTKQYTYTFAGWFDKDNNQFTEGTTVTGSVTYTAKFNENYINYTITWKVDGVEYAKTSDAHYGDTIVAPADPSKESDNYYDYRFIGWYNGNDEFTEGTTVTGDVTYTAKFEATDRLYDVTWVVGETSTTDKYKYNELIAAPADPEKAADNTYTYKFIGWFDKDNNQFTEGTTVTGNVTYTAKFNENYINYIITWMVDGVEHAKTSDAHYGDTIVAPTDPTKDSTEQYTYTFAGWFDKDNNKFVKGTTVTGNVTYNAVFEETVNKYTITWKNDDGSLLGTTSVAYGDMPTFDVPTKPATAQYTYTFAGWTPEVVKVTKAATYTATYTATVNKYTVTWKNYDGTVLETDENVPYGEMPKYDGETPEKAADAQYTYSFKGWDPAVSEVKGDVTYTAQFDGTVNKYTVTWVNYDGTVLETDTDVPYGTMPSYDSATPTKAATAQYTYDFSGWTPAVSEVKGNVTYTAKFDEVGRTYWYTDDHGKMYYLNGELQTGWIEVDGNTYYLDPVTCYAVSGIQTLVPQGGTDAVRCVFDSDCVFLKNVTGPYTVGKYTYWLNSGIIEEEAGLKRVVTASGEVNYYYFITSDDQAANKGKPDYDYTVSTAVKNTTYFWLTKPNDLLPQWGYDFDENGVITHDPDTSKNGIISYDDGLYYCIDGVKAPAGMIKIDGDYYYVNSKGKLIDSAAYYCCRTNGLMDEAYYDFDESGKLIGKTKIGIVKDDDGELRYYVKGVATYVGLIKIDGDYYYVKSNCTVVRDCSYYVYWTHDLIEAGYYDFDADGKLIGQTAPKKNGIYAEDGSLFYYVNDVRTYAGLVQIDGVYYYSRFEPTGEVVHGGDYYVYWTHNLIPEGTYNFDENGKMTNPPEAAIATTENFKEIDGELYYYVNGEPNYAGLIKIGDDYYYVNSSCKIVTAQTYWVYRTNDLLPAGYYTFDESGKIVF